VTETGWPGDPHLTGDAADDGAELWVPEPADLPSYATAEDVAANYLIVPVWWQRAVVVLFVLVFGGFMALMTLTVGDGFDWRSWGWFKRALIAVVGTVVTLGVIWAVVSFVRNEIRWKHDRPVVLEKASKRLLEEPIPVWGLFVGKIRLGDRQSGPNDTPDDIVFVFDLRVPRATVQRQRAVATAWVEKVAERQYTNVPPDLGEAFAERRCVHCADVFGESMRGVWMWRKSSILPYQTLGMALTDPQTAEEFTDDDVLFLRKTPKELRERSRISKV